MFHGVALNGPSRLANRGRSHAWNTPVTGFGEIDVAFVRAKGRRYFRSLLDFPRGELTRLTGLRVDACEGEFPG